MYSYHERKRRTKSRIRSLLLVGFLTIWPFHRSGYFLSRSKLDDCLR